MRGSKPGERRGGRQKGTKNKRTRESVRQKALEIEKTGVSPLDFLLGVMGSDDNPPMMRLDAAKAAAPYVHARLQAVTIAGDPDNPLRQEHTIDLSMMPDNELARLLYLPSVSAPSSGGD